MPLYKVVDEPTFLGNTMRQPGETVEYSGWPGSTLEPADEVAQRVKDYYAKHRGPKLARQPDIAKFVANDPKAHLFKPKDKTDE